jgi:hypothetical protein
MKYAVEMGSGAMVYIAGFIKIGSVIQKLTEGMHMRTHRQQAYFYFFKIRNVKEVKRQFSLCLFS